MDDRIEAVARGWEPIETAPMDTTLVALRYPDFDGGPDEFSVARWSAEKWCWVDSFNRVVSKAGEASHYMILPEPPRA